MQKKKVHARNKMRKRNLGLDLRDKAKNAEWLEYCRSLKVEEKRRNKWLGIRKFFGLLSVKECGVKAILFFSTTVAFVLFLSGIALCLLGLFNDPYLYGGIGIDKILLGCLVIWLFGKLFYYLCRILWSVIIESFKEKRAKKGDGR